MCADAQDFCNTNIVAPLVQDINVTRHSFQTLNNVLIVCVYQPYFTPNPPSDPYPRDPEVYLNSVLSSIGAEANWTMTNETVYINFALTGTFSNPSRTYQGLRAHR